MFIRDAVRFVSAFLVPISESIPQIYLSALPFTPKHSLVGEKFCPRFPNTLTISDGRPSQWPRNVFVAEHTKCGVKSIVLSPDEKIFALISDLVAMHVCDSETGHRISGPFMLRHLDFWKDQIDACFSPDGKHILIRYHRHNVLSCCAVARDIERGEEVFQIVGFDFVFIHCGRDEGRLVSIHWMDEDGRSIWTITSEDQHPTRALVKFWNIENGTLDRLFVMTGIVVTRFSPNGQYMAAGRQSESVVELWNLEDGKIAHQFLHPPGKLSSLQFSPTSDCLMATFRESRHICLWRLDTEQMMSFDLDIEDIPPVVIHLSYANYVFVPRDRTVKIWEVSATGLNMILKTEPLTTEPITSICASRNGHRLLMGSRDGTVRMWNLEDLGSNQPVTQDDADVPYDIAFSPSGNMMTTRPLESTYIKLWDTATWELVGSRDIDHGSQVVFSAGDNRIAILSESLVTIWDISHPENCLSFDPWPKGRGIYNLKAAFQTCDDLVISAQLEDDGSGLLQVWKVKDNSECMFSLDIAINYSSEIFLAHDGLTAITHMPTLCYSWNHDTAQFHPFHFVDEEHLGRYLCVYSPDGELQACCSPKDHNIRLWNT